MKKIKLNYLWFVLSCLPFWGIAQTHLVNQGQLVSGNGFLVLANSQLTNNGTINHTTGTVKMMGDVADANSAIGGSVATTFNNLTINKTANNVPLGQDITINGTLAMEGGHIDLQAADLTASTITGAMTSRYIKTSGSGELKQQVSNNEVTFPVGNSAFNPVKISNTGAADLLGVRVEDQVLEQLTSGDAIADASVNRVWHLTEATAGGSNATINLQWNEAEELANFDRSQAVFSAFENGAWTAKNTGAATGSNPYAHTGTGITTLGAFSIGNIVCEVNGNAILGIVPPNAGVDQLDICGSVINLAATIPDGSSGAWSFAPASPNNNATFGNMSNIASSLTGVFGGIYTLRWTVADGICINVFDEVQVSYLPDADLPGGLPDGVQDCVDICLGGNDLVNSDGMGAPDDCDCFPNDDTNEFVELMPTEMQDLLHDVDLAGEDTLRRIADFELSSVAEIEAKSMGNYPTVVFKAGNQLILEPGFHAKAGSDFLATIGPCRDPLTGEIIPLQDGESPPASQRVQVIANDFLSPSLSEDLNLQVHPTIINQQAAIKIALPNPQVISLFLYNQQGKKIRTLLRKEQRLGGNHYFRLAAEELPQGFYLLQLQGEGSVRTEKLIIAR